MAFLDRNMYDERLERNPDPKRLDQRLRSTISQSRQSFTVNADHLSDSRFAFRCRHQLNAFFDWRLCAGVHFIQSTPSI
jgi:hypothetical protein